MLSRLRAFLLIVVSLVLVAPAWATVVEALDLAGLVHNSQLVVLAQVRSARTGWDESGMRIGTTFTLDVEEAIAGTGARSVEVFTYGGVIGEIGQKVVGEAVLSPGDRAVFFLEPMPATERGPLMRTVGLAQGVWPVRREAGGELTAYRSPAPLSLRLKGAKGSAVVVDHGEPPRAYPALRAEIQALAGSRR